MWWLKCCRGEISMMPPQAPWSFWYVFPVLDRISPRGVSGLSETWNVKRKSQKKKYPYPYLFPATPWLSPEQWDRPFAFSRDIASPDVCSSEAELHWVCFLRGSCMPRVRSSYTSYEYSVQKYSDIPHYLASTHISNTCIKNLCWGLGIERCRK